MIDTIDALDAALLARVKETQCSSMTDVIKPFLLEKSESVLRTRVKYLALHGLIKTTKTAHGRIKCLPVNENRNASVTAPAAKTNHETPNCKPNAHESESGVRYNDDHDSI